MPDVVHRFLQPSITPSPFMMPTDPPSEPDDEYFALPSSHPQPATFLPSSPSQVRPGLYYVFPRHPPGALYLHRLPSLREIHQLSEKTVNELIADVLKRFTHAPLDIRILPARAGYRDACTPTTLVDLDPEVLELDVDSKGFDTYFDVEREDGEPPERPHNPGLRHASYTHYGALSISTGGSEGREDVVVTESEEGSDERARWRRK
ncbi:hypothetical protein BDW02DRAFT_567532, partial [Decorospora gaudefroyi]